MFQSVFRMCTLSCNYINKLISKFCHVLWYWIISYPVCSNVCVSNKYLNLIPNYRRENCNSVSFSYHWISQFLCCTKKEAEWSIKQANFEFILLWWLGLNFQPRVRWRKRFNKLYLICSICSFIWGGHWTKTKESQCKS